MLKSSYGIDRIYPILLVLLTFQSHLKTMSLSSDVLEQLSNCLLYKQLQNYRYIFNLSNVHPLFYDNLTNKSVFLYCIYYFAIILFSD